MLEVKNLTVRFRTEDEDITAINSLSFTLRAGETLAIVGESGSGKSVTGLALTKLLPEPPAIYETGEILLEGRSVLTMGEGELRQIRGNQIAYVFQEPGTSLNPVYPVGHQIGEAIKEHRADVRDIRREVLFWLDQVGITDPPKRIDDYPFQLSGGMQQRVMIAMALCCRPKILVADEPTTALDVTIQKQILDLFGVLKQRFQMGIVLITHNFGIIRGLADKVAVMFRGRLVEFGEADSVLRAPQHPYTRALIDCVPRLGADINRLKTIDYSALNER
jgi:peptide/nickel transport system ATP-binding protein/oligopeptide transport system ATP-binding protein